MSRRVDLLIVRAGPAGLSAAIMAQLYGVDVLRIDEQMAPGGQIWRGIEAAVGTKRALAPVRSWTRSISHGLAFWCRLTKQSPAVARRFPSPLSGRRLQAQPGPNQVKAFTRAGMGPCQGRQCNYTIAHMLADAAADGRAAPNVGLYRLRPPFKPITVAELAALDNKEAAE